MIHCPELGWAPVTGRISRLFTLSPNFSPPLLGVTRCLLDRVQGLCPCVPQGQSVGKSSCGGDEGSQEQFWEMFAGRIRERGLCSPLHTASVQIPQEKHTPKCTCVNSTELTQQCPGQSVACWKLIFFPALYSSVAVLSSGQAYSTKGQENKYCWP